MIFHSFPAPGRRGGWAAAPRGVLTPSLLQPGDCVSHGLPFALCTCTRSFESSSVPCAGIPWLGFCSTLVFRVQGSSLTSPGAGGGACVVGWR